MRYDSELKNYARILGYETVYSGFTFADIPKFRRGNVLIFAASRAIGGFSRLWWEAVYDHERGSRFRHYRRNYPFTYDGLADALETELRLQAEDAFTTPAWKGESWTM